MRWSRRESSRESTRPYRALAFKDAKDVRLVSRDNKEFNYPRLLTALKSLPAKHVVLEAAVAALDGKGRSANHPQRQVQIAD